MGSTATPSRVPGGSPRGFHTRYLDLGPRTMELQMISPNPVGAPPLIPFQEPGPSTSIGAYLRGSVGDAILSSIQATVPS